MKKIMTLLVSATLVACGGGGSEEASTTAQTNLNVNTPPVSPAPNTPPPALPPGTMQKSTFNKPLVSGLRYSTASNSGSTSTTGEFDHLRNENIVFSIGDISFPEILASNINQLFELAQTHILSDPTYLNMTRLLFSIDTDGDASNGIQISEMAHAMAAGVNVSFSASDFDTQVANFVSTSGAANTVLLSEQAVKDILTDFLDTNRSCPRTNSKVGQVADLSMISHDVQGRLRILNDCTIEVSNFSYDGGGLGDVRFYNLENSALYGENLANVVHMNETFLIKVTPAELDEINRLSVWCVPAGINFGDGTFR